jgi:exonuclease III
MGCALLLAEGTEILETDVFPELPKPQRGLRARIRLPNCLELTAISWHTPNAAGDGRATKMAAYRAMSDRLQGAPRPLAIGADLNTWHDQIELEIADPDDAFFEELEFVGRHPRHGLLDAYRALLENEGQLEGRRPPLAISHVLSSGVGHRMDRIFISPDLRPVEGDYWYDAAIEAGSDHALHWVGLRVEA